MTGQYLLTPDRKVNFPAFVVTLPAGIRRIISIDPSALAKNREDPSVCRPAVCVREAGEDRDRTVCRDIEILGPSAIYHTPDAPLADTNGRGVCYLVTEAAVRLFIDKEEA